MVNTLIRTGNKGILQSLVLVVLVCAGIITTTYIGLNTGYIRPDMSRYMAEWTDRCCLSPSEYPWPCPYTPGSAEVCMTGGDVLTQPLANATVDFCSSHELGEDLFNRNETDVITLCATSEGYSDDVKGNEGYVDCVYVPIPVCVDGYGPTRAYGPTLESIRPIMMTEVTYFTVAGGATLLTVLVVGIKVTQWGRRYVSVE